MNNRPFSTIRAIIPAADWFAVYAIDEEPFYVTSRLQCLVAGRTVAGYDQRTGKWKDDELDDIGFIDMDDGGVFEDPTNMSNFLTFCHERDVDEVMKEKWSQMGQAYLEKHRKKAA